MKLKEGRHGLFYGCVRYPTCRGSITARPDGAPAGIPGNRETKDARNTVHAAFHNLWSCHRIDRSGAYALLREILGLEPGQDQISALTAEQCRKFTAGLRQRGLAV
jgi:ssDNA-binding Zn-finger/Zn-ribbon topoisomerase 1